MREAVNEHWAVKGFPRPSDFQIDAYDQIWVATRGAQDPSPCTVDHLMLTGERTMWNRGAARILLRDEVFPILGLNWNQSDRNTRSNFVKRVLGTIENRWKEHNLSVDEKAERNSDAAVYTRQKTVSSLFISKYMPLTNIQTYYSRVKSCTEIPSLQPHLPTVRQFGINGTSSDEEMLVNGRYTGNFEIKKLPWRSLKATSLFRYIDSVTIARRSYKRSRGNRPRTRVFNRDAPLSQDRPAVTGLPVNAYDKDWFRRQGSDLIDNVLIPLPAVPHLFERGIPSNTVPSNFNASDPSSRPSNAGAEPASRPAHGATPSSSTRPSSHNMGSDPGPSSRPTQGAMPASSTGPPPSSNAGTAQDTSPLPSTPTGGGRPEGSHGPATPSSGPPPATGEHSM